MLEHQKTSVSGAEQTKGRIAGDYTRKKLTHCMVFVDSREYPHSLFVIQCLICLFCVLSFSLFSFLYITVIFPFLPEEHLPFRLPRIPLLF